MNVQMCHPAELIHNHMGAFGKARWGEVGRDGVRWGEIGRGG